MFSGFSPFPKTFVSPLLRRTGKAARIGLLGMPLMLAACGGLPWSDKNGTASDAGLLSRLNPFDSETTVTPSESGIGVNGYLWRASLDALDFMPMASTDPFGGVIVTDWYSAPSAPAERFKVNVYILDKNLRADGLRVTAFKQVKSGQGWKDASIADGTARQIENAILSRARELRLEVVELGTN